MPAPRFASDPSVRPEVTGFLDLGTNTISYVVKGPASPASAIIDPVLDIDYAAGRIAHDSANKLIAFAETSGFRVEWLIWTHVHADHLSAAAYLQGRLGGRIGIGAKVTMVQEALGKVFNRAPSSSATARSSTGFSRTVTRRRSRRTRA